MFFAIDEFDADNDFGDQFRAVEPAPVFLGLGVGEQWSEMRSPIRSTSAARCATIVLFSLLHWCLSAPKSLKAGLHLGEVRRRKWRKWLPFPQKSLPLKSKAANIEYSFRSNSIDTWVPFTT